VVALKSKAVRLLFNCDASFSAFDALADFCQAEKAVSLHFELPSYVPQLYILTASACFKKSTAAL